MVRPTWRTGWVSLALVTLAAGCAGPASPPLGNAPGSGAVDAPQIAHGETEFVLPPLRQGDTALFDASYSYREPDFEFLNEVTERLTILGPGSFVDGYGTPRATLEANLTLIDRSGQENFWFELHVDASTGQLLGLDLPHVVESFGYASNADGAGLLRLRADLNSTGVVRNALRDESWFDIWAVHGGLAHGLAMPKDGVRKAYLRDLDATLELRSRPVPVPGSAARVNLTGANSEAYELQTKGSAPGGYRAELTLAVSPGAPFPLAMTFMDGRGDPATDGWAGRYEFTLIGLTRGSEPLVLGHGAAAPRPPYAAGEPLAESFPLGGPSFLPFTPDQGAAAARTLDPDIATWFTQNPGAFLSYAVYATYNMNQVWGGAYNHVPPEHQDAARLALWYLEYTNPANGNTAGFATESYLVGASASPAAYERFPWWGEMPPVQNFFTWKQDRWLRERAHVATFAEALAYYREAAPPAYAGKDPNIIEFATWGDSQGGDGYYFLDYFVTPGTAGQIAGTDTGLGVRFEWSLHMVGMGLDGFRGFSADFVMTWEDQYSLAGVPLPISPR